MSEVVQVNGNLNSWKQVQSLLEERRTRDVNAFATRPSVRVLNLHCNKLALEDGDAASTLDQIADSLLSLDLSFNIVDKLQHLHVLANLRILNLSNNMISDVSALRGLTNLTHLRLAYNRIRTLSGFSSLHTPQSLLQTLDLRGNAITEAQEFAYLIGCTQLRHLQIRANHPNANAKMQLPENPICESLGGKAALEALRGEIFHILPTLTSLDGCDRYGTALVINGDLEDLISDPAVVGYKQWFQSLAAEPLDSPVPQANLNRFVTNATTGLVGTGVQTVAEVNSVDANSKTAEQLDKRIAQLESSLEKSIQLLQSPQRSTADDSARRTGEELNSTLLEWLKSQLVIKSRSSSRDRSRITQRQRQMSAEQRNDREEAEFEGSADCCSEASTTLHELSAQRVKYKESGLLKERINNLETQLSKITDYVESVSASHEKKVKDDLALVDSLEEQIKKLKMSEESLLSTVQARDTELDTTRRRLQESEEQSLAHRRKLEEKEVSCSEKAATIFELREELKATNEQLRDKSRNETQLVQKLERALQLNRQLKDHNATLHSQYEVELATKEQFKKQLEQLELDCRWQNDRIADLEAQSAESSSKLEQERLQVSSQALRATQLQGELNGVKAILSNKEKEYRQFVDELKSAHAREIANYSAAVSGNRESNSKNVTSTQSFLDSAAFLQRELSHQREVWNREEQELKRTIANERTRFDELHQGYRKLNDALQDVREQLSHSTIRERELQNTIQNMNATLSEQKRSAGLRDQKHLQTVQYYEEKVDTLESELKKSKEQLKNSNSLQQKLGSLEKKIDVRERQFLDQLKQLEAAKEALQSANSLLQKSATLDKQNLAQIESRLASAEDAVRVKDKMLDDQNQTIANLKQNLAAKLKEQQARDFKDTSLEEQLQYEIRAGKELAQELQSTEEALTLAQESISSLQVEKHSLEIKLSETTEKLYHRQQDIARIEAEVAKVKQSFAQKDTQRVDELAKQVAQKTLIIKELKAVIESVNGKLVQVEGERDNLTSQNELMQGELDALKADKNQLELQIKNVSLDLEREKSLMNLRMSKIKSLFDDSSV